MKDHKDAIQHVMDAIVDPDKGAIKSLDEINAIGHRVVHAGEKYANSVLISDSVIKALQDCIDLAPLHNPPNLDGIEACRSLMPGVPMVAVFDTAFHQTMAPEAFLYAVPYNYYTDYKVRKYGFHGTSHRYISLKAPELLGKKPDEVKLINCHIGNGASLCAIEYGKCIDTSMGISPLEGLMMGTRSGDIDPTVVTYIMQKEGKTAEEMLNILNKKSGLLGICGKSDMREVDAAAEAGDAQAELALKMYARRIQGYIGNYYVQLHGCDAIVFTAGIGEHDAEMRARVCDGLDLLGIKLDPEKNKKGELIISTDDSPVKILLVPTDEELMIANDTAEIVSALN